MEPFSKYDGSVWTTKTYASDERSGDVHHCLRGHAPQILDDDCKRIDLRQKLNCSNFSPIIACKIHVQNYAAEASHQNVGVNATWAGGSPCQRSRTTVPYDWLLAVDCHTIRCESTVPSCRDCSFIHANVSPNNLRPQGQEDQILRHFVQFGQSPTQSPQMWGSLGRKISLQIAHVAPYAVCFVKAVEINTRRAAQRHVPEVWTTLSQIVVEGDCCCIRFKGNREACAVKATLPDGIRDFTISSRRQPGHWCWRVIKSTSHQAQLLDVCKLPCPIGRVPIGSGVLHWVASKAPLRNGSDCMEARTSGYGDVNVSC
mmetsp:Transcript_84221/g.158544  ORF Transcript_84221/g.158544 Transcript_84221/m.158544 type:complete len:315 (+) Transcript_84221:276-1220(+)